jgi:hypothetical protein
MKSTNYIPGFECKFSFDDLYKATFNKSLNIKEKRKLQSLPQEEINEIVLSWTQKAGWKTKKKKGNDGKTYVSFYP